jgi:restriction endonuclease S subunit
LTINDFSKFGSGIFSNGSLNKKSLGQIKIHIPSIERQKEIVEYCEYNDALIKQLEKEILNNKKQAEEFIKGIVKTREQTETIDDIQNEIISVEEDEEEDN